MLEEQTYNPQDSSEPIDGSAGNNDIELHDGVSLTQHPLPNAEDQSTLTPDCETIYGFNASAQFIDDLVPVFVVETQQAADILIDDGLAAIQIDPENWNGDHITEVRRWSLFFTFGNDEWKNRVSELLGKEHCKIFQMDTSEFHDAQSLIDYKDHMYQVDGRYYTFTKLIDDALNRPFKQTNSGTSGSIAATPFDWTHPANLPEREWLYGTHLIRNNVGVTVAAGGVGKSRLLTGEAIAMASGRDLFGTPVPNRLKVWMWNLEDDKRELSRCIQAACIRHGITREELEGHLFVDSGRDQGLCTAAPSKLGDTIREPVYQNVTQAIRERGIDVLIIDPFVSSHNVSENDNGVIDAVVKRWGKVAYDTNCAIELVHHTRKEGSNPTNADSTRGGGAIVAAARDVRVLNQMTKFEAPSLGVSNRRQYFSVGSAKSNFASMAPEQWYHIESVYLQNGVDGSKGDSVGVAVSWTPPDPVEDISPEMKKAALDRMRQGDCKYSPQASDWAGIAIAPMLEVSASDSEGKVKLKGALKKWEVEGLIKKVRGFDPISRKNCPYYEVCERPPSPIPPPPPPL